MNEKQSTIKRQTINNLVELERLRKSHPELDVIFLVDEDVYYDEKMWSEGWIAIPEVEPSYDFGEVITYGKSSIVDQILIDAGDNDNAEDMYDRLAKQGKIGEVILVRITT